MTLPWMLLVGIKFVLLRHWLMRAVAVLDKGITLISRNHLIFATSFVSFLVFVDLSTSVCSFSCFTITTKSFRHFSNSATYRY